jgi:hypothetical protein
MTNTARNQAFLNEKKVKKNLVPLYVTIKPDTKNKLQALADEQRRSLASMVEVLIIEGLQRENKT